MNGGEVIGSGGFGCVFKPSLKCKGQKRSRNKDPKKISKLMTKRHTKEEFKEIEKFKKILSKIPNYDKYYLLNDIKICIPEKLSEKDLHNFASKCSALQKDNITKLTINKKINKLMALNMPDGGIDLGDYIDTVKYENMEHLNNMMIDFLINGIIPMNKHGVYHSDVKDSNILFKVHVRLIDWGLSTEHKKGSKQIPSAWKRRPFQYNVPFSSILFNSTFDKMYTDFLSKHKSPTYETIRVFTIDYIYAWTNIRGSGHFNAFNRIFRNLYSDDLQNVSSDTIKEDIIKFDFTFNSIVEYITHILLKFTKNGKILLHEYMNTVFAPIIDVWGFIMCYNPIIEKLYYNYHRLNEGEKELFESLKNIFLIHLFKPRVEPINVTELISDLKGLNKIFDKCANATRTHSFNGIASGINTDVYQATFFKKEHSNTTKTKRSHISSTYRTSKTRKIHSQDKKVTLYST